jgi:hypothetical protein
MATLVDDLVPDELWALVASLLPAPRDPRSQLLRGDRLHGPHLDPVAVAARPGSLVVAHRRPSGVA